jgi:diacylglycerol kinase (ATP)
VIPAALKVFTPEVITFSKEVHNFFEEVTRFFDKRLPYIFK